MNLMELHNSLVNKDNKHFYIFTGEEIFVRDQYILNIVNMFTNTEPIRVDSVSNAIKVLKKPRISNAVRVFIVSDDKTFTKEEKAWYNVNNTVINGDDILILTYSNIDKRGKFYKHYKDTICEFDKLSDDVLEKYINRDIDLNPVSVKQLIDICNGNYNRIRLEEDKINQLAQAYNIDCDEAFKILLEHNVIYTDIGDITFNFTDAIMLYDLDKVKLYLEQSKLINEPPILTLSVLYNGFRNIYLIQNMPKGTKDISKILNLTPWQIKKAREKSSVFNNDDLIYILSKITEVEQGIKTGLIDVDIAIDYLLVNIL